MDAHGLNDPVIARQGLYAAYVDGFKPDIIEFHVYSAVYLPDASWAPGWPKWDRMMKWMYRYAKSRGYDELAVFQRSAGSRDYDWYFIRSDCPDYEEIVSSLGSLRGVISERWQGEPVAGGD